MPQTQNKDIVRHLFRELNGGNFGVFDKIFAEDFVDRYPVPGETPNREGLKRLLAGMHDTFPDWHWSLNDMLAEGDKIAYRSAMKGTDKGGYIGMPPTGKKVTFAGVGILRFANGKVVERWTIGDSMTLMHQLGLV
jgi:steroid delta-isomerase-like uncharacterized protein